MFDMFADEEFWFFFFTHESVHLYYFLHSEFISSAYRMRASGNQYSIHKPKSMNNAQKLENTFFVNVWACVCVCACGIIYFFCIIIMTNLLNRRPNYPIFATQIKTLLTVIYFSFFLCCCFCLSLSLQLDCSRFHSLTVPIVESITK